MSVGKRLSLQVGGGHGGLRRTGRRGGLALKGILSVAGCRSRLWFETSAHKATAMAVQSERMRGDHATRLRSEYAASQCGSSCCNKSLPSTCRLRPSTPSPT